MQRRSARILDVVERLGNRLPDPLTLFVIFCALVLLASWMAASAGVSVVHPGTGELVVARSLLSREGFRRIITEAVPSFVAFPPLGTVLVVMLGVGVAEQSGLVEAGLTAVVRSVPRTFLTATVIFAGVNASLAADAGYVVLPPLAALLFARAGRHPLAGLAAAVAGVGGGFSANLLLTSLDPLLAGLTQAAARLVDPNAVVTPTANYYFMVASTFLLTGLGTAVNAWIVEPRLGAYRPEEHGDAGEATPISRSGLWAAGLTALVYLGLVIVLARAFLLPGIVTLLFLAFLLPGIAYGLVARTIRSDRDVARMMGQAMAQMGTYVALAFVAAQFLAWFSWSNLGLILALKGASFLKGLGLGGIPLLLAFLVVSSALDLFVSSASAKWAVLAPVFVPMFMLLGITPDVTQATYRVADSFTNIITPLNPYFPMVIVFVRRWQKDAGVGTVLALAVPYALVFAVAWAVLLSAWIAFRLPFGV